MVESGKITYQGVDLISVRAEQTELDASKASMRILVNPVIVAETDAALVAHCEISFGVDQALPLQVEAKYSVRYLKTDDLNGEELLNSFAQYGYPIFAEFGLLLATLCKHMDILPLMLDPEFIVSHSNLASTEN